MAKEVKTVELDALVAAKIFVAINSPKVRIGISGPCAVLFTDIEPQDLLYPEGWYYGKGSFRNKHNTSTGRYSEIIMLKNSGELWEDKAKYCNR